MLLLVLVLGTLVVAAVAPIPLAAAGAGIAQPPQPAPDEFVPLSEIPPEEQLPAAPLLVTAYAFVWVAVLWYVWSVWRRLARVERELGDVARRAGPGGAR
jgi:CcmD family protein